MKNRRKIELEKFTSIDFEKYFELVSNKDVVTMMIQKVIPLYLAELDFELILRINELDEQFGYFKIFDQETNSFIGLAKIEIKSKDAICAELGCLLLPSFGQKGFVIEIAKKLIEIARQNKNIEKLTVSIEPSNLASKKVLIDNGFVSSDICEIDGLPAEMLSLKF